MPNESDDHPIGPCVDIGFALAGLPPAALAEAGGPEAGLTATAASGAHFHLLTDSAGLPLGLFEDAEHDLRTVPFPPGASMVLCSDALTESPDRDGVRLGEDGLVRAVAGFLESHPPEFLLDHIVQAFRAGIDTAVPDELALICVWRHR